jgi:hypothetical protein
MPARSSQGFANAQISSGPALTVRQPAFVRMEKRRRAVAPKRLRPEPKQNSKNSWRQIGLSLKEAPIGMNWAANLLASTASTTTMRAPQLLTCSWVACAPSRVHRTSQSGITHPRPRPTLNCHQGGAVAHGLAARRPVTARALASRTRMIVLRLVLNSRASADTVAPCSNRRSTALR